MRSHLTAFGVGAGLSLVIAGVFAVVAPRIEGADDDDDGVHVINIGDGENGSFHLRKKGVNLSAEWKGDFSLAADGRSLSLLKGSLSIQSKEKDSERKVVFSGRDGSIISEVFVDGRARDPGSETSAAAGDLLLLLARSSGIGADDRVKAMLASGGKQSVIDEMGELIGSHAIGGYVEALASASSLSRGDVELLTSRIKGIDSDYAKRNAITALLRTQELDGQSIANIVDAAKTIEGDHELRLIVEALTEKKMNEKNFSVATALIGEIDGDHEIRLAVASVLESDKQDNAKAAKALEIAAANIEGDYELRLVAEAAGERVRDLAVGAAALAVIKSIEGPHDRRLAIEEFAGELEGPSPHWAALIDAAASIDGDHERRLAIESLISDAPETDEIRAALRKAAETIGSDHERRLALEALG